jgi:hypothetical protein
MTKGQGKKFIFLKSEAYIRYFELLAQAECAQKNHM